jgi:hypothetical protein
MFKEYGVTEIGFPALPIGEDAQAMRDIVKRSRRLGKAGKPTGGDVSAAPYSLNML